MRKQTADSAISKTQFKMEEIYKFKAKIKSAKTSMTKSLKESDEILEKFSEAKTQKAPNARVKHLAADFIKSLETAKQKLTKVREIGVSTASTTRRAPQKKKI